MDSQSTRWVYAYTQIATGLQRAMHTKRFKHLQLFELFGELFELFGELFKLFELFRELFELFRELFELFGELFEQRARHGIVKTL